MTTFSRVFVVSQLDRFFANICSFVFSLPVPVYTNHICLVHWPEVQSDILITFLKCRHNIFLHSHLWKCQFCSNLLNCIPSDLARASKYSFSRMGKFHLYGPYCFHSLIMSFLSISVPSNTSSASLMSCP